MKTKTVNGTSVEVIGLCGDNMLFVNVANRSGVAQVNARDLIGPAVIPDELKEYKFFDPVQKAKEDAEREARAKAKAGDPADEDEDAETTVPSPENNPEKTADGD